MGLKSSYQSLSDGMDSAGHPPAPNKVMPYLKQEQQQNPRAEMRLLAHFSAKAAEYSPQTFFSFGTVPVFAETAPLL